MWSNSMPRPPPRGAGQALVSFFNYDRRSCLAVGAIDKPRKRPSQAAAQRGRATPERRWLRAWFAFAMVVLMFSSGTAHAARAARAAASYKVDVVATPR